MTNTDEDIPVVAKKSEWKAFFLLSIVFLPVLTVAALGGYGFIVWMLQIFVFGPPGAQG